MGWGAAGLERGKGGGRNQRRIWGWGAGGNLVHRRFNVRVRSLLLPLRREELGVIGVLLVEGVEGETAGDEAVAGSRGAIAEGATETLAVEGPAGEDVGGEFGVGEDHAAEADDVNRSRADGGMGDVGEPVLEVGVPGA